MRFTVSVTAALLSLALATSASSVFQEDASPAMIPLRYTTHALAARDVAEEPDYDTYVFTRRALDDDGEQVVVFKRLSGSLVKAGVSAAKAAGPSIRKGANAIGLASLVPDNKRRSLDNDEQGAELERRLSAGALVKVGAQAAKAAAPVLKKGASKAADAVGLAPLVPDSY